MGRLLVDLELPALEWARWLIIAAYPPSMALLLWHWGRRVRRELAGLPRVEVDGVEVHVAPGEYGGRRIYNATVTPPPMQRVVVSDAVLELGEAARAVVAHELGHIRLGHLWLGALTAASYAGLLAALVARYPGLPALALAAFLLQVLAAVLLFRRLELEADWFAAGRMPELHRRAMEELERRVGRRSLLDRLLGSLLSPHPPPEARLKAGEYRPESAGGLLAVFLALYLVPSAALALHLPPGPLPAVLIIPLAVLSAALFASLLSYLVYRLLRAFGFGFPEARLSVAAWWVANLLAVPFGVEGDQLIPWTLASTALAALALAGGRREALPKAAAAWALVMAALMAAALLLLFTPMP